VGRKTLNQSTGNYSTDFALHIGIPWRYYSDVLFHQDLPVFDASPNCAKTF